FLGIDVIAVATTGGTTDGGTDQCAFGTILLARRGGPDHGSGRCADAAIDAGFASLAFAGVGIGGTASEHGHERSCCDQITPGLHNVSLGFLLVSGRHATAFEPPGRGEVPPKLNSLGG